MKGEPPPIYQLKISLWHIKPPIWRRVLVPGNMVLLGLHQVIQVVFGWPNTRLHIFRHDHKSFIGNRRIDEEQDTLEEILAATEGKLDYEYDLLMGWRHEIELEKILEADPDLTTYPICIAGKRNRPFESWGGPRKYMWRIEALNDPDHPEHQLMVDELGEYDLEYFDLIGVNQRLARMPTPR